MGLAAWFKINDVDDDCASTEQFCPSVRMSVCHAPVLYGNSLTRHHTFFSYGSPIIPGTKRLCKIPTGSPLRGTLNTGGIYKFRDFRPISGYMWETIEDRAIYYGTVIGNHMRSVEPWHFRWPWVTCEGHFSDLTVVTLCTELTRDLLAIASFFFSIKTLGGVTIYGHWVCALTFCKIIR